MGRIEKRLHKQLETSDTKLMYSTDPNELIRIQLTRMLVGKCFYGCFITAVTGIVNRSPLISDHERTGGHMRYSVQFDIAGIQYTPGEIVPVATLKSIMADGQMLFEVAEHTKLGVEPTPVFQHLRIGDRVPLRVANVIYPAMRPAIVVTAIPLTPVADISQEYDVNVDEETVKKIIPTAPAGDAKRVEAVRELLYPYRAQPRTALRVVPLNRIPPGKWRVGRPSWLEDPWSCTIRESKTGGDPAGLFRIWSTAATAQTLVVEQIAAAYTLTERKIWEVYRAAKLESPLSAPAAPVGGDPEMPDHDEPLIVDLDDSDSKRVASSPLLSD